MGLFDFFKKKKDTPQESSSSGMGQESQASMMPTQDTAVSTQSGMQQPTPSESMGSSNIESDSPTNQG